jgi:hypothetical protein
MAVINFREVIPRTFSHKFGEAPTAERKFVVTVDEPTPQQAIINAIGIFHGAVHPEYFYLRCLEGSFTETDRQHVEATFRYELPEQPDLDPNPLARPDVWSFSVSGSSVPALAYYDGVGNGNLQALVNSAGEFIEGLTTLVGEVKATIAWNRPTFPLGIASQVTNSINDTPYLGGAAHTWQCAGISSSQEVEVVNDVEIRYWSGTTELVYRPQTWNLVVPDVGFTFKKNGKRKRSYVENKDGEYVDSPSPVPLQENGDIEENPDAPVRRVVRRVYQEVNFNNFFGVPPF